MAIEVVPEPNQRTVQVQGVCGGIASSWDWRLEDGDPKGGALLVDANATLLTAADFGCALHETEPIL